MLSNKKKKKNIKNFRIVPELVAVVICSYLLLVIIYINKLNIDISFFVLSCYASTRFPHGFFILSPILVEGSPAISSSSSAVTLCTLRHLLGKQVKRGRNLAGWTLSL